MAHRLSVCVVARTDAGGRENNEDSFLALHGDEAPCDTLGLFAVADGMGGNGNGHVASSLALETLSDAFAAACEVSRAKPVAGTRDLLRFAMQKANAAVYQASQRSKENRGMGTTCIAAAVTDDHVHIAHVGDSRAYLFREGHLRRLIEDQWVKQPQAAAGRSETTGRQRITLVDRAVGWQPLLTPETLSEPVQGADVVLVCSDGLTDEIPEPEIERVLTDSEDIPQACDRLMRAACSVEGCDNVTLVMAKLLPVDLQEA